MAVRNATRLTHSRKFCHLSFREVFFKNLRTDMLLKRKFTHVQSLLSHIYYSHLFVMRTWKQRPPPVYVGFISITRYRVIDRGIRDPVIIAAPRDQTISLMKASLTRALLLNSSHWTHATVIIARTVTGRRQKGPSRRPVGYRAPPRDHASASCPVNRGVRIVKVNPRQSTEFHQRSTSSDNSNTPVRSLESAVKPYLNATL